MPTYEFESGSGKRLEMYFKLGQRPDSLELGGEKYVPVISKVAPLLVSTARDKMTDDELLDDNIKTALKKYESVNGTAAVDQFGYVSSNRIKRELDNGPVKRDPDAEAKEAEQIMKEQAAIARGDIDPGYHDLPDEEEFWRNQPVIEMNKEGEVLGKEKATPEIAELMANSGKLIKRGTKDAQLVHA